MVPAETGVGSGGALLAMMCRITGVAVGGIEERSRQSRGFAFSRFRKVGWWDGSWVS